MTHDVIRNPGLDYGKEWSSKSKGRKDNIEVRSHSHSQLFLNSGQFNRYDSKPTVNSLVEMVIIGF